jgi:3-isopropylmalate dehydratase small subunit
MEASEKMVKKLQEHVDKDPDTIFVLDVEQKKVIYKDEAVAINMQDERRQAFLEGTWDIIATLKNNMPQIQEKHQELFYK